MTLEPIKEPKNLWEHFDGGQWLEAARKLEQIHKNRPKQKKQRAKPDIKINIEEIEEIEEKAIELNFSLWQQSRRTSKKLLRKLKKIEKFYEKYNNRLNNIPVVETPGSKKFEVLLYLEKMRYDILKAYYEKFCKENDKNGTS